MDLSDFLKQLKVIIPLLIGAITLFLGLINFDNIIPEPISKMISVKTYSSIIIFLALVSTLHFAKGIKKRFKAIIFITIGLLVLLLLINTAYVVNVDYGEETKRFIIGTGVVDSNQIGRSNADIIKDYGDDMEFLKMAYKNYTAMVSIYSILISTFIFFIMFCLGGLVIKKSKKGKK